MDQSSPNSAAENEASSPPALINLGVFSFLDSILGRLPTNGPGSVRRNVVNPYTMRLASVRPPGITSDERSSSAMDTSSENTEESVESPPTDDIEAGGFKDSIFLYLSEKERDEFSCCICYLIMNKVYQCRNEHHFCFGCIYTWSCGSGQGHDRCPMCRIDGLYAFNKKMSEKIANKCVTCENDGCNWLGTIRDFEKHEHRYYTPSEFQILTMFRAKNAVMNIGMGASVEPSLKRDRDIALNGPVDSEAFINSRFSLQNTVRRSPIASNTPRSRVVRGHHHYSQHLTMDQSEQSDSRSNDILWTVLRPQSSEIEDETSTLVYKRLVPSNWQVACEQLRETREQLAAMLTLMTMELDERRNQILSDTQRGTQTLPSLVQQVAPPNTQSVSDQILRPPQPNNARRSESVPSPQSPAVRFNGIFHDVASPSMQRARSNLMNELFDQANPTRPRRLSVTEAVEPPEHIRTRSRTLPRLQPISVSNETSPIPNLRPIAEVERIESTIFTTEDVRPVGISQSSETDSDDVTISTDFLDYGRELD